MCMKSTLTVTAVARASLLGRLRLQLSHLVRCPPLPLAGDSALIPRAAGLGGDLLPIAKDHEWVLDLLVEQVSTGQVHATHGGQRLAAILSLIRRLLLEHSLHSERRTRCSAARDGDRSRNAPRNGHGHRGCRTADAVVN